jgi:hypothetical protein
LSAESEIQKTISRFANSFDLKNWELMRSTLSDKVTVDYSDLRGDPIQEVTSAVYVQSRKDALQDLDTHHLIGNFEIEISKNSARVRASGAIFRRTGERVFNTHAIYVFGLVSTTERGWLITSIKQSVLWNEGDSAIHKAAVNTTYKSLDRTPDTTV